MKRLPPKGLGILIEQAMSEKKLIRKAVADSVGVDVATLGRWITGSRTPGKHQAKLMQVLGLSVDTVAAQQAKALPNVPRDAPGRWKRYAARYAAFDAHARDALAAGVVTEGMLDLAADRLGVHKGAGPTEAESRQAILDTIRRVDAWKRAAIRDATDDDFREDS